MVPSPLCHLGSQPAAIKLFWSGLVMAKGATRYKQLDPKGRFIPQRDKRNSYTLLISLIQLCLCLSELPMLWCSNPFSSTGQSSVELISLSLFFCEVHSKVKNPSIQLLTLTNLTGSTTDRKTLSTVKRQKAKCWAKPPHHTSYRTHCWQIPIYQQGKSGVAAGETLLRCPVTLQCPCGGH